MSINVRMVVDLPDRERDQLDALCRQRGVSLAEAIRLALGRVVHPYRLEADR